MPGFIPIGHVPGPPGESQWEVTAMEEKGIRTGAYNPGVTEPHFGGTHHLQIANRENLTLTGVLAVESFDDEEILLDTEVGALTIRGEDLHIKQLDLEQGRFSVDGMINALQYATPRQRANRQQRSRGFLERLLK